MQKKLKPGDTFIQVVNGQDYEIEVMSVGAKLDAEEKLDAARESGTASAHYRAWLEIVDQHVVGESVRDKLTAEGLGDLLEAVLRGNEPDEADLKN